MTRDHGPAAFPAAHSQTNAAPAPAARKFSAPGRVNLIGEHTDYSGGLVMPAAINFRTIASIRPRSDDRILLRSSHMPGTVEYDAGKLPSKARKHWSDYPMGVLWCLSGDGIRVGGFDLDFSSDLPIGAGLSSSASINVATALALLSIAGRQLPQEKIVFLCQRAENEFVGAMSGIMDPFIACAGRADHAMMLDCRSLEFRLLPLPSSVRIVICNTMVKHSLAGGEYNLRRKEVEEGTEILRGHKPSIRLLRDAGEEDLSFLRGAASDSIYRRCRHVVRENRRVESAAEALLRHDLAAFGCLMSEAHDSIRNDFEASSPELDLLVDLARRRPGCYGARMTGGGFGGCTVNLVHESHAAEFRSAIRDQYRQQTGIDPDIYLCRASNGAGPEIPSQA